MHPDLVLDSNALSTRGMWTWLQEYPGRKILPIVAYVEVGYHLGPRMGLDRFRELLQRARVEIEWMRVGEANRALESAAEARDFEENARDHFIAGHATPGRFLVTNNLKDFTFLDDVVTPEQAMRRFQ